MSTEIMATPPRRRRSMVMAASPALNSTSDMLLLDANDDVKEKRARRRSQLLTNNISSPGGVPASPGRVNVAADREKRKSVAQAGGMSNDQVKAHYASCIKLSSENKINIKNAFALHLIDYMKELLQQSQSVDSGTNFQVASCTLDAGVKIYSYRVDSVHKDTFKVLGSLGGVVDNKDDEDEEGQEAEGPEGSQKTKTVKKRKKVTIEKNLNKITSEQFDLDFEVDPYFHKTSAAFDEGGVKGLLLLQVRTDADSNQLRMDSDTNIKDEEVKIPLEELNDDLNFFKSSYSKCDTEILDICPSLKSFQLCGWDKDGNIGFGDDSFDDNVHRFDVNAPVIPPDTTSMDFDTDYDGGGGCDDFSDNENQNDGGIGPVEFDTREAQFSNAVNASVMNLTGASTMPLEIFPLQTSEYSFFRTDILSMWRGPLHWKYNQRGPLQSVSGVVKKVRPKKDPFRIDYDDDEIDIKKMLSSGRAQTYLREITLKKHTSQMTTLPPKVIYDLKNLFNMFLQDKFVMKHMKDIPASTLEKEDDVTYNYDNKNDREGFCPAIVDDGGNDYDDYDDDVGGAPDATFDATSQPLAMGSESLIAPPTKVRILDINYAKSAKRIDIKKLKKAMWNMLTISDKGKENIDVNNTLPRPDVDAAEEGDKDKSIVSGNYTFKSMYTDLPSKITTNMAKNLSGPISFVCLLYLANEKNLTLTSTAQMDDILIKSN